MSSVARKPPSLNGSRRQQNREHDQRRRQQAPWRNWYKTARWQRKREHQLSTEPLCEMCKAHGRTTEANVADHKVPHRGDPDLFWNGELQSLCEPCHNGPAQRRDNAGGEIGSDLDGRPIDPGHPWNAR